MTDNEDEAPVVFGEHLRSQKPKSLLVNDKKTKDKKEPDKKLETPQKSLPSAGKKRKKEEIEAKGEEEKEPKKNQKGEKGGKQPAKKNPKEKGAGQTNITSFFSKPK